MPYTCDLRKCDLCLAEKLAMAQFEGVGLLNKQTELLSKCQHRNKIIITNIKWTIKSRSDWINKLIIVSLFEYQLNYAIFREY